LVVYPDLQKHRRLPIIAGRDADELDYSTLTTSPDGRWLLWATVPSDEATVWHVRRLRGTAVRRMRGPASLGHMGAWMPDSSGWIELRGAGGAGELVVHPLADSREAVAAPIEEFEKPQRMLGITARREALVLLDHNKGNARLGTIGLPPETVRARSFDVPFATTDQLVELSLNDQGDQLAWVFDSPIDTERYPTYDRWLSIWVSTSRGKNLHSLGRFASRFIPREPSTELTDLTWTKDGRGLRFAFDDRLWNLPVQ
jgi:hypothetical protein